MRILCVDDDGLVLAVTADLLRELGHEVIEAAGGRAAEENIRTNRIDLLVTDMCMPGGPGGEELAGLARAWRPGLPVIYFSGLAHQSRPGTGETVLMKPCNLGDLQQAIAAVRH